MHGREKAVGGSPNEFRFADHPLMPRAVEMARMHRLKHGTLKEMPGQLLDGRFFERKALPFRRLAASSSTATPSDIRNSFDSSNPQPFWRRHGRRARSARLLAAATRNPFGDGSNPAAHGLSKVRGGGSARAPTTSRPMVCPPAVFPTVFLQSSKRGLSNVGKAPILPPVL